jgi:hypothetical protein
MKKLIVLILIFCCTISLQAQDKAGVEAAVRDYVEGFYYGDTARIINSISPDLIKHGYYRARNETSYVLDTMSYREAINYAANVKKRGVSPNVEKFPKQIEVYDVLDKTACAKVTAWWGTDYLLLAKLNDKWMITHVLWQSPPASK